MRKSASLFATLLALALAAPAYAVQQQGVALRWDNCFGDWGSGIKSFACDTNIGSERLVLSYTLDHDKSDISGLELVLDVVYDDVSVPSWWMFRNAGSCRLS